MQKICCFWLEFEFFRIEFFLECSKVKPDLKVNVAKIGVKESVKWNTFFFLNPACHVYLLLSNHSIYCVT